MIIKKNNEKKKKKNSILDACIALNLFFKPSKKDNVSLVSNIVFMVDNMVMLFY